MSAGTDSRAEGSAIALPKGGGAVSGLGESFSPDFFTGTGNFSVPVAVPAGRLGLQPQLPLGYSTGTGDGPFGLGWQLSVPGVSRETSRGVPRYVDVPRVSHGERRKSPSPFDAKDGRRAQTDGYLDHIRHARR